MFNRKGGISIVRVALIVAVIGIILIAGAVVSYISSQNSARQPLDIPLYPNAVYWGTSNVQDTSRNVFYRVADTPEAVAAYYTQKMKEQNGSSDQTCVRLPAEGNAPGSDTNPNISLYVFRCVFDNSGLNTFQYTQVDIFPGRADPDPNRNADGLTIVEYEQQWQS